MSLAVVGTGTDVGKTVACAVILARYGRTHRLAYWKPIATGGAAGSDSSFVKRVSGGHGQVLPEEYLFEPPVSPHLAARLSRRPINPERVIEALVRHGLADEQRSLVVEGIGGLLVPLTDSGFLLADLLAELHLPCLLVGRSALGTINHTMLSLEAMRARRLLLAGVILSGPPEPENRKAIERFGGVEIVAEIPEIRPMNRAGLLGAARRFDRKGRLKRFFE